MMIQIDNKSILHSLKNHENGEVAYVRDEKKFYVYNEGWVEMQANNDVMSMSLYEMNQMILGQVGKLEGEALDKAKETILNYISDEMHKDDYYMLLCHEIKYFTVFIKDGESDEKIEDVLLECLNCIGEIKSIERTEDKEAIEIWVTTPENDTYVMYFFDYGRGIVPCRI